MKPDLLLEGPRGLFCPCGARLDTAMVAQTYPTVAGVYRRRCCRACLSDIESVEVVLGREVEVLDITHLNADERKIVTLLIRTLKRAKR